MNDEKTSLILNILFGILAGFASWKTTLPFSQYGRLYGSLIAIAIFALSVFVIRIANGPKSLSWIMSKGGGWYFWLAWLITWTVIINV